jgi:aspartate aminotransferase
LAALEGPQDFLATRAAAYQARRDLVVGRLNEVPGLTCHKPNGAFYVFPEISGCLGKTSKGGKLIANDTDFAFALMDEAYVAVVQGAAFAMSPHIRISTATSQDVLARACTRIAEFCAGLK